MDINQFQKLEESLKEESFNKEYKSINVIMFWLSIFGHISSIFLAFFLLSKILSGAITDNPIVVFLASMIMLSGLELLKRDIFQKFSTITIKAKSIAHKSVYPLLITSFAIISISFYASVSGAKEFASKSKQIDVVAEINTKTYSDSLTNSYNIKIKEIEEDSKVIKSKMDQKDSEQTTLESDKQTFQQKNRVKDLKLEKESLKQDIIKNDTDISRLKVELSTKIKDYESKIIEASTKNKSENKTNTLLFVIISTMIEFVILAGVYFNRYYKIRSYNEYKLKIEKDPNFQKWATYDLLLDVIYNPDTKSNDKVPSVKSIVDLSKLNGKVILLKDATDFVKILTVLGIFRSSGNTKYFAKSKDLAKEIIKSHFNIK